MPEPERPSNRYAVLANLLTALASETRLALLHKLRTPLSLHEIQAPPSLSREGESPERPLSRQAVAHHLDQLSRLGLVNKIRSEAAARGEAYVLNHERLFALVDEIRGLAKLRPIVTDALEPGLTTARPDASHAPLPPGPRLVVAFGRDDGLAFGLKGEPGTTWKVGRSAKCEIRLDYDPFLSSENTVLERHENGFRVVDVATNRNGTWLNWARLPRGGSANLKAGDVIIVGRSTLVFQE